MLNCIDTQSCREAVFPFLQGYTVTPEIQTVYGYFCENPLVTITVHNPLALSDVDVMVNRQKVGEIESGKDGNFSFAISGSAPRGFTLDSVHETRQLGVDAQFLRGHYASEIVDKDKKMGKTISVNIHWSPSHEQSQAFQSITQLEMMINSCKKRANESVSQLGQSIAFDNYTTIISQAKNSYQNCDFISAGALSSSVYSELKLKCDEAYPKSWVDTIVGDLQKYFFIVFIAILGAIFVSWLWSIVFPD